MNTINNNQQTSCQYKDKRLVYNVILTYCLGQFFWGYQLGVYTSSAEPIHKTLNIQDDNQATFDGFVTSLLPFGGLVGSLLSFNIFSRLSRLNSLIFTDILGIIGCFLSSMIYSAPQFCLGRFILGLNAGLNQSLVSTIVKEFTPVEMLQLGGTLPIFVNNMGVFAAYLLGIGFAQTGSEGIQTEQLEKISQGENYLFFVYIIPIILPIIRIIILKYKYTMETPLYYIEQEMENELQFVLELIYKEEYVNQVSQDYQDAHLKVKNNSSQSNDLFSRKNQLKLKIGITLMYFMQLSGTYAIIFFATKIFSQATQGNNTIAVYLTVGIGLTPVICSYMAGFLSQQYGRKILLQFGMAGLVAINFILSFLAYIQENRQIASGSLSVWIIIFTFLSRSYTASAYGPNSFAYSADILCPKTLSIVYLFYWGFESVVGFIFPIMIDKLGISFAFFFFAMNCLAGFYFVKNFIRETKGLSRKEIECLFDENQTRLFEMV